MGAQQIDHASIAGKPLDVSERTQLLVVGAGAAGVAAALEARRHGLQVVLVDENPVSADSMGEDIPLMFGQRATGAVRNRNAMIEAIAASTPVLEEALDAGVDVRLGTVVWGLYANGTGVNWLPGRIAGLSDGTRSWLLLFEEVIVATGRRDMGLAIPGWDLPGVMGATAAEMLSRSYGALDVRRAFVLGSTAEALSTALTLQEAGVEIIGILEQAAVGVGPAALLGRIASAGIPLHCSHAIDQIIGDTAGVKAVVVVRVDGQGRHQVDSATRFACDTVILGVGVVPVVELLDAVGCRMMFQPARGGYVPLLMDAQRCSLPGFHAAGDCAGIWPEKSLNAEVSRAEGVRAATDICAARGLISPVVAEDRAPSVRVETGYDLGQYRIGWVRASLGGTAFETYVCRCEEVTAREILEVRPPRYLGQDNLGAHRSNLHSILGEGVPNPDHVKRLTRAGMGICQGRRCREQIQALLALGAGATLAEVPLASYRPPVRPLSLRLAGQVEEPAVMTHHWDVWFGMAQQYAPPWEIKGPYTAAGRNTDGKGGGD